jgi:hypothetical protein
MPHTPAPPDSYSFADVRLGGAVVLLVTAAVLLAIGSFVFALDNFCEDACDKPAWSFWPALGAAGPWLFGALASATLGLRLRAGRGGWRRALVAAILDASAFVIGLVLITGTVGGNDPTRLTGVVLLFIGVWAAAALHAVRIGRPG